MSATWKKKKKGKKNQQQWNNWNNWWCILPFLKMDAPQVVHDWEIWISVNAAVLSFHQWGFPLLTDGRSHDMPCANMGE